jgi:hypothetical protein
MNAKAKLKKFQKKRSWSIISFHASIYVQKLSEAVKILRHFNFLQRC